jgi:hypothetical protein
MLALRWALTKKAKGEEAGAESASDWYGRLRKWVGS